MRYLFSLLSALCLFSTITFAQEMPVANLMPCHASGLSFAKTTVLDPIEDKYDVKYMKLNLNVTNDTAYIWGDVTTKAVVVQSPFTQYAFELDNALTIDSVLLNGSLVRDSGTFTGLRYINLSGSGFAVGTAFTVQVFYHGTPRPASSTMGLGGFFNQTSGRWGNKVTYSLSQPSGAYYWMPCKQSLTDKIDSCDVWVTVPDTLKAGSNGVLVRTTTLSGNRKRFEWKEKHTIDYYLISVAVANYVDYTYYMHFTGSTDSMPIQNYVYNNAGTLPTFRAVIDSTGLMIDYFSSLFGRYPFSDEKYGHSMAPIGGGMEHQTMTTLGFFNAPLIAHELGHQWWGDNVTCASWADIAMNEGFASYCEYIFHDHFEGHNSALYDIDRRQTDVKRYPGGIIYTPRDTTTGRVFDSRLTYNKGACALHTLRGIINNDAQFFTLLKNYQNRYANGNSMISTFQNETRATVGSIIGSIPIDTFFNQWYYAEGYPVYTMSWYQADTTLFLRIMQTTTVPASVSCFTLPIEFTLRSTSGDTLIRVENHLPDQRYQIPCTKRITSLIVDPNYWLIYDLLGITKDPTLALNSLSSSAPYLVSNPASTAWTIEQLPAGSAVNLYSLEGKLLWTGTAALHSINIPAEALPAGMYIAEIKNDAAPVRLKLVKTAQ